MLTEKDITLQECLQFHKLAELPDKFNPEDGKQLLKGISLVRKQGGIESYVCTANDGNGGIKVVRDFGKSATIVEYLQHYAVSVLDSRYKPKLKSDEEYLKFLVNSGANEPYVKELIEAKDYEALNFLVEQASLRIAERNEAEKKRCEEIKEFAEKAKKEQPKKSPKSRISYGKKNSKASND